MQRLSGEPAETAAPLMIEGNMRNGKYMMGFVAAPRNEKIPTFLSKRSGDSLNRFFASAINLRPVARYDRSQERLSVRFAAPVSGQVVPQRL